MQSVPSPRIPRARALQETAELADLRLPGRAVEDGFTLGLYGQQDYIFRRAHAGKGQMNFRAMWFLASCADSIFFQFYFRAHLPKGRNMDIHRPFSDNTAARIRQAYLSQPPEKASQQHDRRTHFLRISAFCLQGFQIPGVQNHSPALSAHPTATAL